MTDSSIESADERRRRIRADGALLDPLPEMGSRRFWQWYLYQGLEVADRFQQEMSDHRIENLNRKFDPGNPMSSADYYDRFSSMYPRWGTHLFEDSVVAFPDPPKCLLCGTPMWSYRKVKGKKQKTGAGFKCESTCPHCKKRGHHFLPGATVEEIAETMRTGKSIPPRVRVCEHCHCVIERPQ